MTDFFWAGCHQFQIEPEVLIKPSALGFFFILTGDLKTPAWLLSTNSSTFFHAAVSYHPVVGGCSGREHLAEERLLSVLLRVALHGESIARRAGVLSPCRCTANLLTVLRTYVNSWLRG